MCTSTVAVLLITAIDAVNVGITSPADRNTVSTLALELVAVALQITAVLKMTKTRSESQDLVRDLQRYAKSIEN